MFAQVAFTNMKLCDVIVLLNDVCDVGLVIVLLKTRNLHAITCAFCFTALHAY
jgi:hypothetical protein